MLIRGVACTKNIKHKRMTSQHKNPRLLLLGGSLEFQGVSNQLESFDILRQKVPSLLAFDVLFMVYYRIIKDDFIYLFIFKLLFLTGNGSS